jgi:phosphomannomutase
MLERTFLPVVELPEASGFANAATPDVIEYRCPGEHYSISRAIHLARLASFYDKCRDCPQAHDDGGLLSTARRKQLDARPRPRELPSLFDTTGVRGVFGRELSTGVAGQLAMSFGRQLCDAGASAGDVCFLATDGGLLTPEIVAATSEALRWSGLSIVDLGATTAPALVATQLQERGAASLYIGQSRQPANQVTLQIWGPDARPWSLPGSLEGVRDLALTSLDRPTRRAGTAARAPIAPSYLERLRNHYHALRPLRIVLDTACEPWRQQFSGLLKTVRCELNPARATQATVPSLSDSSPALPCSALGQHVIETSSHLGLWIADDGGSLAVVDEHGQRIELPRLAATLAAASGSELHIDQTDVSESAYLAMHAARAGVGCCAGSRIWFADEYPPLADPLAAITALLVLLSQSDRGLSEVLDENSSR